VNEYTYRSGVKPRSYKRIRVVGLNQCQEEDRLKLDRQGDDE